MQQTVQKQAEKRHKATLDNTVTHMSYTDVHHMTRAVLGVAELSILSKCAEAKVEECQEMATEQNVVQFTECANTLRIWSINHMIMTLYD